MELHTPHRWGCRRRILQSMPSSDQLTQSSRQSAKRKPQTSSHYDRQYSLMTLREPSTRSTQQHCEKSCYNGVCPSTSPTGLQHSIRTGSLYLILTRTLSKLNHTNAAYHKDPLSHQSSSSSTAMQCWKSNTTHPTQPTHPI